MIEPGQHFRTDKITRCFCGVETNEYTIEDSKVQHVCQAKEDNPFLHSKLKKLMEDVSSEKDLYEIQEIRQKFAEYEPNVMYAEY